MNLSKIVLKLSLVSLFYPLALHANDPEIELSTLQSEQGFEQNLGQFTKEDNLNNEVLFMLPSEGINVWVTTRGLVYHFYGNYQRELIDKSLGVEATSVDVHRVDMAIIGAKISLENIKMDVPQKRNKDYFLSGDEDAIEIDQVYRKLTFKNIYPNIDWLVYLDSEKGLKHDFIVHPGGDPELIQLVYEGSGEIHVSNSEIQFKNKLGGITEGDLFCYQSSTKNTAIGAQYNMKINKRNQFLNKLNRDYLKDEDFFSVQVAFNISSYDKTKNLVIDPALTWSTLFAGTAQDYLIDLDTDSQGNLFVVGESHSQDFPLLNSGTYFWTTNLTPNVVILKFDGEGKLLWSTFYGGSGFPITERGQAVEVDIYDNVWVYGVTTTNNFPVFDGGNGAYFFANHYAGSGSYNNFLLKFDNHGNRLHATYFKQGYGRAMCTDNWGNIYITGDLAFVDTLNIGTYFQPWSQYRDAFIAKFNNSFQLTWSTYFGGSDDDYINDMTCDDAGNLFVTGFTYSLDLPLFNPGGGSFFQSSIIGTVPPGEGFIAKFDNIGNLEWSTFIGGLMADMPRSIASNSKGEIWVGGHTQSSDFPVLDAGTFFQGTKGINKDCFLSKFDNNGVMLMSTFLGGDSEEDLFISGNMEVDKCDNLYFGYESSSGDLPVPVVGNCSYYNTEYSDSIPVELVISEFTDDGQLIWTAIVGNDSGEEIQQSIAIDSNNTIYSTGTLMNYSPVGLLEIDLINPGGGAYFDNTINGTRDPLIMKFEQSVGATLDYSMQSGCSTCDASVNINIDCGRPPFSLWWSTGESIIDTSIGIDTIYNLCSGKYWVAIASDCESLDTIHFTISGPYTDSSGTDTLEICFGDSVLLAGSYQMTAGDYGDTLFSAGANTCDSLFNTHLIVKPVPTVSVSRYICQGDSMLLGGVYQTTPGIYNDTLFGAAANSCDSILEVALSFLNRPIYTTSDTMCQGESVLLAGSMQSSTGVYRDTLYNGAANGCDSIIETSLLVKSVDTAVVYNPPSVWLLQPGDSMKWMDCITGNIIPGAISQFYYAQYAGSYGAIVYQNGCIDTSRCITTYGVGIGEEMGIDSGINLFPNLGNGKFSLTNIPVNSEYSLEIFDSQSRMVHSEKLKGSTMNIDISRHKIGIYLVFLKLGNKMQILKYVKED